MPRNMRIGPVCNVWSDDGVSRRTDETSSCENIYRTHVVHLLFLCRHFSYTSISFVLLFIFFLCLLPPFLLFIFFSFFFPFSSLFLSSAWFPISFSSSSFPSSFLIVFFSFSFLCLISFLFFFFFFSFRFLLLFLPLLGLRILLLLLKL